MNRSRANRRNPLILLLWAGLLLFGQTAALAHQHFDDAPGTACAVCPIGQAETAACDAPADIVPTLDADQASDSTDSAGVAASPPRFFRSRAPPAT